jgi:hypothetical protein
MVMPGHEDLSGEIERVDMEIKRLDVFLSLVDLPNLRKVIAKQSTLTRNKVRLKKSGYDDSTSYELWKISRKVDQLKHLYSPTGSLVTLLLLVSLRMCYIHFHSGAVSVLRHTYI